MPVGAITLAWALRYPCWPARGVVPRLTAALARSPAGNSRGQRDGQDRETFVSNFFAVGSQTMIGDDAKHLFAVFVITRERAEFFGHLRGVV